MGVLRVSAFRAVLLKGVVVVAGAMAIGELHADPITYSYTGSDYDLFTSPSPYTSAENLTISFTAENAIAPSSEYLFNTPGSSTENPTLIGWSSFDGIYDTSSTQTGDIPFLYGEVSTDASGDIITWAFAVGQSGAANGIAVSDSSCYLVTVCENVLTGDAPFDYAQVNIGSSPYEGAASNVTGTWTETGATTPEPRTLFLVGTGFLALWRKRLFIVLKKR